MRQAIQKYNDGFIHVLYTSLQYEVINMTNYTKLRETISVAFFSVSWSMVIFQLNLVNE